MRKSLIGAAAALASASLFAQATVHTGLKDTDLTIYGVVDMVLIGYDTSVQSKTVLGSGGSQTSRLGFLASRGFSPDLKAGFRVEAGINADTGTPSSTGGVANRVWSRQAYFLLASKRLGELRVGRVQGPTYDFVAYYDPMLMPTADSWGVLTTLGAPVPGAPLGTGLPNGFNINPTIRTDNTIEYVSPKLYGFTAKASYSFNERSTTVGKFADLSLNYSNGPLDVGIVFLKVGSTAGAGTVKPTTSVEETAIAASYDFGIVKPYVQFQRKSNTDPTVGTNGLALNGNKEDVKLFGAIVPVSVEGKVRLTYGKYSSGSVNRDATSSAVAYTHDLDPGLMLYAGYSHLSQGSAGQWLLFQSAKPAAGKPVNAVVLGAAWRF